MTESITVRRLLKTNREKVFNAFNNSSTLSQWLSPSDDITVKVLEFHFKVGGRYRLQYTYPDGKKTIVGGTYSKINSPEELSFSWVWEEPDPMAGILTNVQIRFVEKNGGTEVVLNQNQLPSKEACEFHKMGWEGSLNRLENNLNNK